MNLRFCLVLGWGLMLNALFVRGSSRTQLENTTEDEGAVRFVLYMQVIFTGFITLIFQAYVWYRGEASLTELASHFDSAGVCSVGI